MGVFFILSLQTNSLSSIQPVILVCPAVLAGGVFASRAPVAPTLMVHNLILPHACVATTFVKKWTTVSTVYRPQAHARCGLLPHVSSLVVLQRMLVLVNVVPMTALQLLDYFVILPPIKDLDSAAPRARRGSWCKRAAQVALMVDKC